VDFLADYGAFLLKTITLVGALLVVAGAIANLGSRHKSRNEGELTLRSLNDELEEYKDAIEDVLYDEDQLKAIHKARNKLEKAQAKADKKRLKESTEEPAEESRKRVYVLDFNGDVQASDVDFLRHEITAVLTQVRPEDEVVLRLESPGGMVHTYGLAASQLKRIRDRNIRLTICVDEVAASGGYMMACLADHIVAAPFALVGSIGVMAQLPNFSKILKKYDVDYELYTAGEYKRTVTMFGENTPKAREKFQSDLEETHVLFKQHIQRFRPTLDLERVANGDVWYGQQALDMNLIDALGTSDDYLVAACDNSDVFVVRYEYKKTLQEKIGLSLQAGFEKAVTRVLTALQKQYVSKG
jgi:serine protease SohB